LVYLLTSFPIPWRFFTAEKKMGLGPYIKAKVMKALEKMNKPTDNKLSAFNWLGLQKQKANWLNNAIQYPQSFKFPRSTVNPFKPVG
jgi:hypothetical protein